MHCLCCKHLRVLFLYLVTFVKNKVPSEVQCERWTHAGASNGLFLVEDHKNRSMSLYGTEAQEIKFTEMRLMYIKWGKAEYQ